MNLTVEIPDDMAQRLSSEGGDLSRRALEALAAEEYRQGRLYKPDLRRLLGFTTSDQIDTLLKAHEVWIDYSLEDVERERAGLRRLGL
jgi:chromosome segregation and condensation protein ScpB